MQIFNNITWGQFAVTMGLLLLAYYTFILLTQYRTAIKNKLSRPFDRRENENDLDERDLTGLESLVERLDADLFSRPVQMDKQAFMNALTREISGYSGLNKQALRFALNNHVTSNAKNICGVIVTEEELNELWNELLRNN